MRLVIAAVAVIAVGGAALAQHHHKSAPYAGMQERPIKALNKQQVADLRAGRGMGLALAAELNGYPGPIHVLELADELQLTAEQRGRMRVLTDEMKAEAVPIGEQLIARERALDQAFASRQITSAGLAAMTAQIGAAQGELRAVHLKYHLTTAMLLSDHQRQRYAELRGYR